ncbi:Transposase and inactivated derivatives, IS5 family [Lactococcus raffinolactis 4877]|nr:Transposase and inactivated derivatives, IS5 family [Lactococcus raffinolactis 4877]
MNLFGDSDYLEKLSLKGDPLKRLEKVVDFECFRPTLNRIFKYDLKNKSHGGRPPYDLSFNVENSNFTTLIQSI